MTDLGKFLMVTGGVLAVLGALLTFRGQIPWVGKLPGDLCIKKEHFSFYFPLTTCILVSLILTLLFRFFRK